MQSSFLFFLLLASSSLLMGKISLSPLSHISPSFPSIHPFVIMSQSLATHMITSGPRDPNESLTRSSRMHQAITRVSSNCISFSRLLVNLPISLFEEKTDDEQTESGEESKCVMDIQTTIGQKQLSHLQAKKQQLLLRLETWKRRGRRNHHNKEKTV